MHQSDDLHPDDLHIASRYGYWPAVCGLLLAAGVIYMMFALADGFA